jgi:hypothetical protein
MFYLQAYDIARAEQAAREAQLKHRIAAGLTRDHKPSIVARALAALHDAFMLRQRGNSQIGTQAVTRGVPAR